MSPPAAAAVEPPAAIEGILEERDPSAFVPEGSAMRWRDVVIPAADIARARGALAPRESFGSCSFEEPITNLQTLGWLPRS